VKNKTRFSFLWLLLFLTLPAFGQDPIEIEDLKEVITTESKGMEGQVFDPQICPSDHDLISFQRRTKQSQELYILDLLSGKLEQVTSRPKEVKKEKYEEEFSAPPAEGVDWQLDWRPVLDSRKRQWYVFVGDGGMDNLDLYLGVVGEDTKIKLTEDGYNKFVDGQPKWSPDGKYIVFVSQRTGNGDIYLIEDVDKIIEEKAQPKPPTQWTTNPELDFYPVWNPDSTSGYVAYTAVNKDPVTERRYLSINVFDVYLLASIQVTEASQEFDYTRPSWDPSTGSYLSYFVSEKLMETGIIDMKGGGITQEQSARIGISQLELDQKMKLKYKMIRGESPYLAFDVLPDDYSGPFWLTGSQFIMFVKNKLEEFNPIYVANQKYWAKNLGRFTFRVDQRHKMPADLSIEKDKIVYACQDGKEYKIIRGTISGMDFQRTEYPQYALSRPDLYKLVQEGKVKPGEVPTVEAESPFKWFLKPIVGDNPLIVLNRRITPIVLAAGVATYLLWPEEERRQDHEEDHTWDPPEWPETKMIGFRISFGGGGK
jgi:hypothetical protein